MNKELNRSLARAAVIGFAALSCLAWAEETPSSVGVAAETPDKGSAASSPPEQTLQIQRQMQAAPGSKISLAPLPVTIYLMDNQKPTVAFTTPCIMIERMTNGFPPIIAFENFMFEVIGNINESDLLPIKIEPVCI
ncbi:MAG: hypothetical protein HXY27_07830 [Hydrogenophilaceae bacterium]|nr:hypothetical protein [Hydrogenophilaceae bacterium]